METLTVMSAHLVAAASITVPLQGRGLDASGIAADAGLATALGAAIDALASVARSRLGETRQS
jgi:chromate reductase, NAD(P)H dehydrogenase (quinone)